MSDKMPLGVDETNPLDIPNSVTTIVAESISLTLGSAQGVLSTRLVRLPRDKAHLIREIEKVRRPMVFTVYVTGEGTIRLIVKQPGDFDVLT